MRRNGSLLGSRANTSNLTMLWSTCFLLVCIGLVPTHAQASERVVVDPETERTYSLHTPQIPEGRRYCVDDFYKSVYLCSDDPVETRRMVDGPNDVQQMDLGVPQRIDGSEAEQQGIRNVLRLMEEYYYGEILSNPAFHDVRYNCRNRNELCAFWAHVGECESNRMFMLPNCPAACRFCLLRNTPVPG